MVEAACHRSARFVRPRLQRVTRTTISASGQDSRGLDVETVTSERKEQLASWTVADDLLRLELAQSLKPGGAGKYSIRLRPAPGERANPN